MKRTGFTLDFEIRRARQRDGPDEFDLLLLSGQCVLNPGHAAVQKER